MYTRSPLLEGRHLVSFVLDALRAGKPRVTRLSFGKLETAQCSSEHPSLTWFGLSVRRSSRAPRMVLSRRGRDHPKAFFTDVAFSSESASLLDFTLDGRRSKSSHVFFIVTWF